MSLYSPFLENYDLTRNKEDIKEFKKEQVKKSKGIKKLIQQISFYREYKEWIR